MSQSPVHVERPGREVGTVIAVTPSGHLTVRCLNERFPPEGTDLTDRTRRVHGRVTRVFGPVTRPYLSVRLPRPPRPAEGAALVGAVLLREARNQHGQR